MLDLAAINASILYNEVTGKHIERRDFLLKLAMELQQQFKMKNNNYPSSDDGDHEASTQSRKRRQCQVRNCKGNKTTEKCFKCKVAVCGKCTGKIFKKVLCINCM